MAKHGLWRRIGPAFIVGACIIGPGSVTLMSTTGAKCGYSMLWLSLLAGALMAGFLGLFMRFGIHCDDTFLGLTAKKLGRWYAVLCGISLFLVDTTFQFGNALGVTAGMHALLPGVPQLIWPALFTSLAIVFLFACKHIYRYLEKMMTFFLVFMFCAFLVNLVMAKPDLAAAARGAVVPTLPTVADSGKLFVLLGGLVATTFVIVCGFFQSYTVKAKGWRDTDLASGITDTVLASVMFTLVGTVIMMTAAAVLHQGFVRQAAAGTIKLENIRVDFGVMISQLTTAFPSGVASVIFGVGFWAAAFSSFVTNSCIGGVLLNDGLGFGGKLESLPTKVCATLVLLVGMGTGMYIISVEERAERAASVSARPVSPAASTPAAMPQAKKPGGSPLKVRAIRVGQAATMLAVPLGVIAMIVVLFDKRAFKGGLSLLGKGFVLFGSVVLLGIAVLMYVNIKPEIVKILRGG